MDKALILVTMLFIGMLLVGMTLAISWVMDDDRIHKEQSD